MSIAYTRQTDLISPTLLDRPVTLIGCGGIGSPTALALAKMGVQHLTLYDDDKVEEHNLPNQLYRLDDLGRTKVDALVDVCASFGEHRPTAVTERFHQQPLKGIVVSGVDSMAVRKQIWQQVRCNIHVERYIEARMGAEVGRIHSVHPCDPDDIRFYEQTLYDDSEATQEPCTARAVIYNVFVLAGLIANQVKRQCKREPITREIIVDLATLTLITT